MSDQVKWAISAPYDDIEQQPVAGKVYEIEHSRKGTFLGRVLEVRGNFADVQRLEGRIAWANNANRLFVGPYPEGVGIRDSLCKLTVVPRKRYPSALVMLDPTGKVTIRRFGRERVHGGFMLEDDHQYTPSKGTLALFERVVGFASTTYSDGSKGWRWGDVVSEQQRIKDAAMGVSDE